VGPDEQRAALATEDTGDDEVGEQPDDATDPVEARLAEALERVAHGATVSVPAILFQQALSVAFTAVLTNAFPASSYGLFALARRFQRYAARLSTGFGPGLSRFIPPADSAAERDLVATFAAVLMLSVAALFGGALFLAAPIIASATGEGPRFRLLLQVFAAGVPVFVWFHTAAGFLRAFEEVLPMNLLVRVGFPVSLLVVAGVGATVIGDLVAVAVGVVAVAAVVGTAAAAWVARERGLRPRLRGVDAAALHRRYLRFSVPLFLAGFATVTQRLGFYPLIAWFLSGTAGGVFAVGVLVGGLVRLPLIGINQFISPVAAALHADDHREALSRLYHVTSRMVLVGTTAVATPAIVFRADVMGLFGPTFVRYAPLLPGFVLAQYAACAAGSVAILLSMTDNQRALLYTNVVVTAFLAVTAVPLTVAHGLPGLVVSYLLVLTVNNGLEVVVLYHLEGLQPFTRLHAKPLVAAVPFAAVALAAKATPPDVTAAVVGSVGGLAAFALAMHWLGFTDVERQLGATLLARYRSAVPGAGET
jgi:O-antigen/teichoic acid export membrane protein